MPREPRYMPPKRQVKGSMTATALPTLGTSARMSPARSAPACVGVWVRVGLVGWLVCECWGGGVA